MPGRRFPGVLVQGDTLRILYVDVAELVELCVAGDLEEARQAASLLQGELGAKLQRYTDALDAHGERHRF